MKTKLTKEIQAKIAQYVRGGCYYETAASCAGIGKTTFYRWRALGEKAKTGQYRDFWDAIKKAKDEAEAERILKIRAVAMGEAPAEVTQHHDKNTGKVIKTVTKFSKPDWQAAAWLLERQHPERWAKRDRVPVTGDGEEVLPSPLVFVMPEGTVVRPPRNGDKPNADATVEHHVEGRGYSPN